MRRILIDSRVEKIAKEYRNNLFKNRQARFKRPKVLLQKLLDDIKLRKSKRYNNWKFYEQYLQNLITHFDELLDLKPVEFDNYHKKYFDDPKGYIKDKTWKKQKRGRSSFADTIVKLMRYDDVREKEILPYIARLGIRACVYCNTQYVPLIHIKAERLFGGFELDHNWPKSKYPFLCISFFNLYPVCSNCNGWKKDRKAEFVLYTTDYKKLNPFQFSLDKASIIKYMLSQNPSVLNIVFSVQNSSDYVLLQNHNDIFHTEKYYQGFRDVAEELIWKSKTNNGSYKQQLIVSFNRLFPNKSSDINRFLYGFFSGAKDIHERPLTKLQQDIARQLKIIPEER